MKRTPLLLRLLCVFIALMLPSAVLASVTLSPSSYNFGSTAVGTGTAWVTFTLSNSGSSAVSIGSVTGSGPFVVYSNCGSSVAAAASCPIYVYFYPTTSGAASGTLTVSDSDPSSPQTASLSGTGGSGGSSCASAPSAPTGLSSSGTTSSGTTLSWTGVTPPSNCTVSSYTVLQNGTAIGTATGTSFTVTGLAASTTYSFTVEATDATGTSGPSAALNVTTSGSTCATVPSAPTGLAASGTTSSDTTLRWSAVTPPANCTIGSYTVLENGTAIGTATGTSLTVNGLAASTTYSFTVEATDAKGTSAPSAALSVTTPGTTCMAVPSAPTGLVASGTTSSDTTLSWSAVTPPTNCTVSSYTVLKNGTSIGTTSNTSFTVASLAASTTYSFTVVATDAYGTSPQSAATSVTTSSSCTSNCGGSLPKHLLMGYWQDFTGNGATPLTIAAVPTGYNMIAVAFATSTGTPGQVTFSVDSGLSSALGGYTQAQFIADIATAHSRGQKVILSVGGQNGTVSVSDSTSASNFANSVSSIMTQYGFDGVDIDLENGVSPTYMGSALQQLAAIHPGMIITLAPQTIDMQSTGGDYFQLATKIKSILTMVNTQYYNSGTMLGCDQNSPYTEATENFLTALPCIQLEGGLDPSQVGLGLPATSSAANSGGYVSPSVVNAALDCLASGTHCGSFVPPSTWPTIRGAMNWDINWDATNGYSFVNTVAPHLASMP